MSSLTLPHTKVICWAKRHSRLLLTTPRGVEVNIKQVGYFSPRKAKNSLCAVWMGCVLRSNIQVINQNVFYTHMIQRWQPPVVMSEKWLKLRHRFIWRKYCYSFWWWSTSAILRLGKFGFLSLSSADCSHVQQVLVYIEMLRLAAVAEFTSVWKWFTVTSVKQSKLSYNCWKMFWCLFFFGMVQLLVWFIFEVIF